MVMETVGGVLTGSLGLLAHAAHMVTDTLAIFLALLAMWIAERPATITRTFGFQRVEVIAVLFNAVALWILASWIGYGAYRRVTEHFAEHGHAHEGGGRAAADHRLHRPGHQLRGGGDTVPLVPTPHQC